MPSVRVKGVTGKIESAYGQDAAPDPATDGIQVAENFFAEMTWDYLEQNRGENYAGGGMGIAGSIPPSGRWARLPLAVPLKGTAAAYADANRPEWDVIARCGGMASVVDTTPGAETITYKPISTGFESATFYAYAAGVLYKILGARAGLVWEFTPNREPLLRAEIQGMLVEDPDTVALPAIAYPQLAVTPPVVRNSQLLMHGYAPADFDQFALDMQAVVAEKGRGNAATGHAGYEITNWDPVINTRIDVPASFATFNPFSLAHSGALGAVSMGPIGDADYNRISVSAPATRVGPFDPEEADLLGMYALPLECRNTAAGNDAFQVQMTK